jgi:hypothetical protein
LMLREAGAAFPLTTGIGGYGPRLYAALHPGLQRSEQCLVPLAGIEPALLAELDFESSASTNSATGAFADRPEGRRRETGGI